MTISGENTTTTTPEPNGATVAVDYAHEWYEQTKPDYLAFDTNLPDYWRQEYSDRHQLIYPQLAVYNRPRLLEIGCGLGRAMVHFKELGYDCVGVEPSEYASGVAKSRGCEVINSSFEDAIISGTFDVVYIEQALSHMPNYRDVLVKAYALLNKGGVLMVEEPNDYNPLQRLLESAKGQYWVVPDHCNYFNYVSLAHALEEVGLTVIKKTCTYPMEFFELMGESYIGNDEAGRACHAKRHTLMTSLGFKLRRALLDSYAQLGTGRDLLLMARK